MSRSSGWWSRSVPLGPRLVAFDRGRFAITIVGIGFAVLLMLFLVALYEGIRTEANGYVESRPVHAWVAQDNTTNFIKSTSFVAASGLDSLADVDGVVEVTPLLRIITTAVIGIEQVTVIILGFDPQSEAGRPEAAEGSVIPSRGEIVFDRALARRHGLHPGDTLQVQGHTFRLVGLSTGTNSVMTQFAFITLEDARELLGVTELASFFLVRGDDDVTPEVLAARLTGRVPRTAVFTREAFAANNMKELRGGLLPILGTAAILGAIVALAVLTLLLYGAVLEQRETYAVLRAIGAPDGVLTRLILFQSLSAVGSGMLFGTLAYAICAPLVVQLVPVMALTLSPQALLAIGVAVAIMGMLGALVPLRRVRRIHPAELFRA